MEEKISQIGQYSNKNNKGFFHYLLQVIVIIGLIVGGWLAFTGRIQLDDTVKTDVEQTQVETDGLLDKISKHMILPSSERPVLATIIDADKLSLEDPFYVGSVDGDKLLIWSAEKRAIIYSPSRDIVINMGPIIFEGTMPEQKVSQEEVVPSAQVVESVDDEEEIQEPLKIQVLNGSGIKGAAGELADGLACDEIEIVATANASVDYEELMVISISDRDLTIIKDKLGVNPIKEIPEGEEYQEGIDALIIIGEK